MKRGKKVVSLIALVALVLGCTVTAFADIEEKDLSKGFTDDKVWMKGYYDIGSMAPNDDVSAATHVSIGASMTGHAEAYVQALNGVSKTTEKTSTTAGWVTTAWAVVPGQDYAKKVEFFGSRYPASGVVESYYDIFV